MTANQINWQQQAEKALVVSSRDLSEAYCGAVPWHGATSTLLAFGNRCPPDAQIEILSNRLHDLRIPVRAAASDGESSFAILIESDDIDLVTDLLWEAFWKASPDGSKHGQLERQQRDIAAALFNRREFETGSLWDQKLTGKQGDPATNIHEVLERLHLYTVRYGMERDDGGPSDIVANNENLLSKLARDTGLTNDQLVRLYGAVPNLVDWQGRDVREMYEDEFGGNEE